MASCSTLDKCRQIFVTWIWLAGILLGVIGLAGTLSYRASAAVADMKHDHEAIQDKVKVHGERIDRLEYMSSSIDSIKAWVRP